MKVRTPILIMAFSILGCSHIPSVQSPEEIAKSFPEKNVVFDTGKISEEKDVVSFVVEVPFDSIYKYELRSSTGSLINDRALCPRALMPGSPAYSPESQIYSFPANYGISPGRFNQDGDPIDLLVLGQESLYQDMIAQGLPSPRSVRVVGLMKMEECESIPCKKDGQWLQDWKVLAVDLEDPEWGSKKELADIPKEKLDELATYWSNYKGHQEIKNEFASFTRVDGFGDKKAALKFIKGFMLYDPKTHQRQTESCLQFYNRLANAPVESKGQLRQNKTFLNCLSKVWPAPFFQSKEKIDRFLKISAYHILVGWLKDKSATAENALEKMQARKDANEKHYRFVGFDSPHPGTNRPIFEWVKTYDRDQGCIEKPDQHYNSRPVIDTIF